MLGAWSLLKWRSHASAASSGVVVSTGREKSRRRSKRRLNAGYAVVFPKQMRQGCQLLSLDSGKGDHRQQRSHSRRMKKSWRRRWGRGHAVRIIARQ
ncbi:hypothetical protein XELAEV_18029966mg [Xenopus laevis]|uniref:Uncharacterized protein n=1 Tax=Xenopus laevis TaxID=8355 RepID=A0A974CUE0_XENLA|nr:hypothetical protein XELAEV_18029966mg [Xenopus laevis]